MAGFFCLLAVWLLVQAQHTYRWIIWFGFGCAACLVLSGWRLGAWLFIIVICILFVQAREQYRQAGEPDPPHLLWWDEHFVLASVDNQDDLQDNGYVNQ